MTRVIIGLISLLLLFSISNCGEDQVTDEEPGTLLQLVEVRLGTKSLIAGGENLDSPVDQPIVVVFSMPVVVENIADKIHLTNGADKILFQLSFLDDSKTISIKPDQPLDFDQLYKITLDEISGQDESEFPGISFNFKTTKGSLSLLEATINGQNILESERVTDLTPELNIQLIFSDLINENDFSDNIILRNNRGSELKDLQIELNEDGKTLSIKVNLPVESYARYQLEIKPGIVSQEYLYEGLEKTLYQQLDSTLKFPEISDDALLTLIQKQTFKYFWDFGHPVSGLARERNTSGETVTIGGSGFGIMAILVGIERGFITRSEGIERLNKIVTFLDEKADRFHGVWSHWLNGSTGDAIPFSADDDGGDLVETAFMIQALITTRQYLDSDSEMELSMKNTINKLIGEVEWNWYTQGNQNILYWHWSPNFGWQKNLPIRGWNESLIVYVLGASSENHSIGKPVYDEGWARNGGMRNTSNAEFYNIKLPLRSDRGGPLFFSHYSFLGLDPRNLKDNYADYWEQNVNHTSINRAYCVSNPKEYIGYSPQSWGLTASDGDTGYSAHSPDNDRGVITPTAAISSIPYTPAESMEAIRHFYYILGDKLWGEYGFYDAFNPTENWYTDSYLAIDQGPEILMIENHRTGLLWDLFMSAPEVQKGLEKLEISYE